MTHAIAGSSDPEGSSKQLAESTSPVKRDIFEGKVSEVFLMSRSFPFFFANRENSWCEISRPRRLPTNQHALQMLVVVRIFLLHKLVPHIIGRDLWEERKYKIAKLRKANLFLSIFANIHISSGIFICSFLVSELLHRYCRESSKSEIDTTAKGDSPGAVQGMRQKEDRLLPYARA
jgi:hypothetical protein